MQFSAILMLILLALVAVLAVPVKEGNNRSRRESSMSEKRQQKARSGYIRFGKRRVDPNAELLYLDQLLI